MNLFIQAFSWLFDPKNWGGVDGLAANLAFHVVFSLLVVVGAAVIAVPVGIIVGHTGRGRNFSVLLSGGLRALPTLGLLTLIALALGVGAIAPYFALGILAIPPILAGAYSGIAGVERRIVDAARGQGMTETQIVLATELPLAAPTLMGGIRSAMLQVIATATLAAYVGAGGLGTYIFLGTKTRDYAMLLGVSMLIIALALVTDAIFAIVQRSVIPRGVRAVRDLGRQQIIRTNNQRLMKGSLPGVLK